jgi:hypothetical protein
VSRYFAPVTGIFLPEVNVLLRKLDKDSLLLNLKLLWSKCRHLGAHVEQKVVDGVHDVLTGSLRRLDAKLSA